MGKVRVYAVEKKEKDNVIDDLLNAISNLRSKKEVVGFVLGLLTESETLMIGRRLQIAKRLIDGEGYNTIAKKMKVSHMTIGKVEKWIEGSESRDLVAEKLGVRIEKYYSLPRMTGSLLDKYHRRKK